MDSRDVFRFLKTCSEQGQASVLVTVCEVEGSSMRNPGSVMGVAQDGQFSGSLSGGCIENAVVAEALQALKAGAPRIVRFGAGSPYLDIKLPCGGGLDVHFQPLAEGDNLARRVVASMEDRTPFALTCSEGQVSHAEEWCPPEFDRDKGEWTFGYWPDPRLLIVGHGAGVEALAILAEPLGVTVEVLTPDRRVAEELSSRRVAVEQLERTSQTELLRSDHWTAIIFLFHDHDWEIELMAHALGQPHFYLGAMGGRKAHAMRIEALKAHGITQEKLTSIRAPIGVFHSSRDPQTLALSTLAEVIRTYQETDFEATLD